MSNVHDRRQINTLKISSPRFKHNSSCSTCWCFPVCFTGHCDVELMFSKILLVVSFTVFTLVKLNMLCIQSITIHTIYCCVRQSVLHLYCSIRRSHPQRTWPYLHKSTCACWPEKLKVEKQLQMQSKLTWPSLFLFTITTNLIHEKIILQNTIEFQRTRTLCALSIQQWLCTLSAVAGVLYCTHLST